MAAFGNLFQIAQEPLLKELLKYVMRDESRHVAFGVLSLRDYYKDMPANELARPRGLHHLRVRADARPPDRRASSPARWAGTRRGAERSCSRRRSAGCSAACCSRAIVPNLKQLGLLTPKVRAAHTRLDLIRFEDFDSDAADRQLGFCRSSCSLRAVPAPAGEAQQSGDHSRQVPGSGTGRDPSDAKSGGGVLGVGDAVDRIAGREADRSVAPAPALTPRPLP